MNPPDMIGKSHCVITVRCDGDDRHEKEMRAWINFIVGTERDRQERVRINAEIDAELDETITWTAVSPRNNIREEYDTETIDPSMVTFGDTGLSISNYAKDRAKKADLYITIDGAVYDHKPTWRDRLRRSKPIVNFSQAMSRLTKGR